MAMIADNVPTMTEMVSIPSLQSQKQLIYVKILHILVLQFKRLAQAVRNIIEFII